MDMLSFLAGEDKMQFREDRKQLRYQYSSQLLIEISPGSILQIA